MSFTNNKRLLDEMRVRKKAIRVWKTVCLNPSTGEAYTKYPKFGARKVVWKQGATVKPHRRLPPLEDRRTASAGLYFHMGSPSKNGLEWKGTVIATVRPEDVIAVGVDLNQRLTICVVAATVINDPNPEWIIHEKESLIEQLDLAKKQLKQRVAIVTEWYEGGREEWEEAYQQLKDKLQTIERKKSKLDLNLRRRPKRKSGSRNSVLRW